MSTLLKALVVDDEPLARDELVFMLGECGDVDVVAQAEDTSSALSAADGTDLDVAFVDLRMPGPDGISLAEALRQRMPDLPVVVVSAHDDGAVRAFEARVLDYLLKPVRLERLKSTLLRVREIRAANRPAAEGTLERLAVRRRGGYVVIDIADVVYFEVRDELVWAVTDDDRYGLDMTLTALSQRLDGSSFFRSHRGFLVRLDRIASIEPTGSGTLELVLDHPSAPRLPVARERARLLRARIAFTG